MIDFHFVKSLLLAASFYMCIVLRSQDSGLIKVDLEFSFSIPGLFSTWNSNKPGFEKFYSRSEPVFEKLNSRSELALRKKQ